MKYYKTSKVLLNLLTVCVLGLLLAPDANAQQPPINIALNKPATFSTNPNYDLCTDPGDTLQLTDGKYSSVPMWVQKETVGWNNVMPVIITFDLGSVQPISGVSYSTAAGIAGITWPTAIYMGVSDDNKTWHYAGDLVPLSVKNGTPPAEGYGAFRYVTHELQTKGRYISFGVLDTPFAFVDEIEVYKGDDTWLTQPASGQVESNMGELIKNAIVASDAERRASYAKRRLNEDIAVIREEVKNSNLPVSRKSTFVARLDKDAEAAAQMEAVPLDFKTILPLNETHRDILAVHGEVLASKGFKPLIVWKQHRYAWLPLLAEPNSRQKVQLDISMLREQFRSDDLLLSNASGNTQDITLQLKNLPKGAAPGWLQVYSVAWTDTAQGTPVADVLIPVATKNGAYQIDVTAGMTRKVWFTVDSSKVPAGAFKSTFVVGSADQQNVVPFHLNVSDVAMGTPRFSMGMWDYTNVPKYGGITSENQQAAINMMRSHYVDTPWATDAALPVLSAGDFDAQGNLKAKLDFANFDHWVALWPGARRYFVYAAVGDSFTDAKIGTGEFNTRVGSWAKALSEHMKVLGLKPKQLGLLLVDEPGSDGQDAIIAAWANAIKTAASELTLFEDPIWERPDEAKIQDAFTKIDILCPYLPVYKRGGEPVKTYFENLRAQGKELWFYQFTGPVRLYDPQSYYRYQPWQAFAIGATGQGFWAFGDTGGAPTSWNEYAATRVSAAPAFLDTNTVYDSIHWDAVREGIEDYEELAMLQDAIKTSNNAAWKNQAQQVLDDAVKTVTGAWSDNYGWAKETDPDLADAQLQKVHDLLVKKE